MSCRVLNSIKVYEGGKQTKLTERDMRAAPAKQVDDKKFKVAAIKYFEKKTYDTWTT